MLIPDFQNWDLEKCRKEMLRYRKTQNPKLFNILLARFDKYIIYVINRYKRYVDFLNGEDPQELYHIGILGLHACAMSLKSNTPARLLILRIRSYILWKLRQVYSHKLVEKEKFSHEVLDLSESESEKLLPYGVEEHEKQLNVFSAQCILHSPCLTKQERELLDLKFLQGLSYRKAAKKMGIAYSTAYIKINKAIKKLQKRIVK